MKTFKFKTNIHCENCWAKVSEKLSSNRGITSSKLDMQDANHTLQVDCEDHITTEDVIGLVSVAGYEATLTKGIFSSIFS